MATHPFVMVSAVNDLNYATSESEEQRLRHAEELKMTRRKSHKTVKDRHELVWPPGLELVFLEGLRLWRSQAWHHSISLPHWKRKRNTKRNSFVANYIEQKTGVVRTAKQVGSRIQQLNGTVERGSTIWTLLNPFEDEIPIHTSSSQLESSLSHGLNPFRIASPSQASMTSSARNIIQPAPLASPDYESDTSDISSPQTPTSSSYLSSSKSDLELGLTPINIVTIDVLTDDTPSTILSVNAQKTKVDEESSAECVELRELEGTPHFQFSPRPFHAIKPTITFVSPLKIAAERLHSLYTVLYDGLCVHSEKTLLACVSSTTTASESTPRHESFLYSTEFVPRYWEHLCGSLEPERYTVTQTIMQGLPDSEFFTEPHKELSLLSTIYHFRRPFNHPTEDAQRQPLQSPTMGIPVEPQLPSEFPEFPIYHAPYGATGCGERDNDTQQVRCDESNGLNDPFYGDSGYTEPEFVHPSSFSNFGPDGIYAIDVDGYSNWFGDTAFPNGSLV